LKYYRKLIHPPAAVIPEPPKPETPARSPLLATSVFKATEKEQAEEQPVVDHQAIYGSVTTETIAHDIKQIMSNDADGMRVTLNPGNIRFLGLGVEDSKVKTVGQWEIEIQLGSKADSLDPVRKVVEVLPEEEGSQ
jgi:hypothetical protein